MQRMIDCAKSPPGVVQRIQNIRIQERQKARACKPSPSSQPSPTQLPLWFSKAEERKPGFAPNGALFFLKSGRYG